MDEVQKGSLWMFLFRRQVINFFKNCEIPSWKNFHWLHWDQDFTYICLDNQLFVPFNDQEVMLINLEIPSCINDLQLHKISLPVHYNWYSYTILRFLGHVPHSSFRRLFYPHSLPGFTDQVLLCLFTFKQSNVSAGMIENCMIASMLA